MGIAAVQHKMKSQRFTIDPGQQRLGLRGSPYKRIVLSGDCCSRTLSALGRVLGGQASAAQTEATYPSDVVLLMCRRSVLTPTLLKGQGLEKTPEVLI